MKSVGAGAARPILGQVRKQTMESLGLELRLDGDVLLCFALHLTRAQLLVDVDRVLSEEDVNRIDALVMKRLKGIPTAHLLGGKNWFDTWIEVTNDVLIPRPETELLAAEAIHRAKITGAGTILDIGTGSGCLAVVLATHLPNVDVLAVDTSRPALQVAGRNVKRSETSRQVTLRESDLLSEVKHQPDLLVGNLPYVRDSEYDDLSLEVLQEPRSALVGGGDDGLDILRRLWGQLAARHWHCDVILEIDPRQASDIREIVIRQRPDHDTRVLPDLAGRERLITSYRTDGTLQ